MGLTSLEAISEKLNESKNLELESILRVSGSSAVTKNEYGITIVDAENAASSLIFKNLSKPKYDEVELVKAIDTSVIELKPNIPEPNLNLVPKPLYDKQVELVIDLRKKVEALTITVDDQKTQITDLTAQVQTEINNRLSIEQINDALANQIDTLTSTITDFSSQIATSLQKSVDESILRASLQSQNAGYFAQIEALIKQIDSLNAIIDGLQSQLGAVQNQSTIIQSIKDSAVALGAEVINKVGLVSFNPKAESGKPIVYLGVNNKNGDNQFKYGSSVSITNNDRDPISVEIVASEFLFVPKTKYTISPSQTEKLDFKIGKVSYGKGDKSTNKQGQLSVKIIRNDGTSESKEFKAVINIQHNKSYPSW
jgi:predicted  nucleic acid-binding Zn-ribbon protein